ncbi:DNA-binding transcriptional regulator, XRE-family HTH domain [Soonwooa buanensis]|uniref:DNA-binding transcriptional regulator, XRE-family HTH domain n=1 Tax=Soonwooa buanensis TaxID=619805 RepID=A0A1T5CV90_9FLAO|nr:helix-turn-helix transcriptional regulator [Soonwooa buanensis]SKB63256.1 DNA-binding transcriptional regulator, XRE-family HTH domain [Soonwooa buanensis]
MFKWDFEELKVQIGLYIRKYRLVSSLSQFQLAIEIGLSKDYIGLIERGKTNPTLEILVDISNYINLDLSFAILKKSESELNSLKIEIKELEKKFKNQNKRKS